MNAADKIAVVARRLKETRAESSERRRAQRETRPSRRWKPWRETSQSAFARGRGESDERLQTIAERLSEF